MASMMPEQELDAAALTAAKREQDDEHFFAVVQAIDHAANVDGATTGPLMHEECRNLAMAVFPLLRRP